MEDRGPTVQDAVEELEAANPLGHASSTHIAAATDIPECSVRRILRQHLGLFPYHLSTSQAITDVDIRSRLDFVQWLSDHDDMIDSILWSDKRISHLTDALINTTASFGAWKNLSGLCLVISIHRKCASGWVSRQHASCSLFSSLLR